MTSSSISSAHQQSADAALDEALALDRRAALPVELRVLLEQFPREVWKGHANLGGMAQFWLQRHDMFRELGGIIRVCMADYREGRLPGMAFPQKLVRPLQFFLGELNTHHQVEDYHYFPKFRVGDPRLARGFDILDADHHLIHDSIETTVEAANAMLQAFGAAREASPLVGADGQPVLRVSDELRRAVDDYADRSEKLVARAVAHLRDEEDLIIPLILDRTEQALGVAE